MYNLTMDNNFKEILATEVEIVSKSTPICPFIMGEPGIGKSSIVKAMCEERGWYFFELLCNQLGDKTDLTGCRSVKETIINKNNQPEEIWKQIFFPHKAIMDAISTAKDHPESIVVLFLDEINRTNADITSAILSFTTARTVGTYVFPENIRFVVAGNDSGNITSLDSASMSRFSKYKLTPSSSAYIEFEKNINPYIKTVLENNPGLIFGRNSAITVSTTEDENGENIQNEYAAFDDEAEGFEQITTPRTISGLNAFLNACDMAKLQHYIGTITRDTETREEIPLLKTIVEAHVGKTEFADKLCALIADDVSRGMLQKANTIPKPDKPDVYNDIKRCSDRQTRDAMLSNMTNEDMSPVILYALYERNTDNRDLINALARNYNAQLLTGEYQQQLIALKSHDELDLDNYSALIRSNTPLGDMTKMLLGE